MVKFKPRTRTRQDDFVTALAEMLTADEGLMSIKLQLGYATAKRWSALRNATPLFGYYAGDRERAERQLREFLGWKNTPHG